MKLQRVSGVSRSRDAEDARWAAATETSILEGDPPSLSLQAVNRPLRRLTALLAAMLLLLSGAGDAFGAHPCPHHAAIGAPGHAAPSAEPAEHAAPADAHHGHGAHGQAPAQPADDDGHSACTCGGICPVSTGPAPIAPSLVPLPFVLAAAAPAAQVAQAELPSRFVPHFLPFAQAPPPSA